MVLFTGLVGFLLYQNLGRDPLFDWDEGIYGELGRELLQRGNLLTSSWNYSLWLEKPPGVAWVAALGMSLQGVTELGARLLMPLFAIATLWGVYLIGKKLMSARDGIIASLFLASFDLFLSRSRALNTDGALLASIVFTFWAVLTGLHPFIVGLFVFLGVWFKGLAGLLPLLIVAPLFINKVRYGLRTVIYSALLILPWHIYQLFINGSNFVTPYLKEQVVRRVSVPIEFHMESRWFYFVYLYQNLGFGIILILAIGLLVSLLRVKSKKDAPAYLALVWWFLLPIAVFTLAKTRLFWYILPLYPAVALLVSLGLSIFTKTRAGKGILNLFIVFFAIFTLQRIATAVELSKKSSPMPDRNAVAHNLSGKTKTLMVLVPESERTAESILPADLRISSSFRYGGMPSIVFYYQGPVVFYYDRDDFKMAWEKSESNMAMLPVPDYNLVQGSSEIVITTPTYLGVKKK